MQLEFSSTRCVYYISVARHCRTDTKTIWTILDLSFFVSHRPCVDENTLLQQIHSRHIQATTMVDLIYLPVLVVASVGRPLHRNFQSWPSSLHRLSCISEWGLSITSSFTHCESTQDLSYQRLLERSGRIIHSMGTCFSILPHSTKSMGMLSELLQTSYPITPHRQYVARNPHANFW